MAASLYDTGRNAFLNAGINFGSDTIKLALVGAGYSANMATDQFYSSVQSYVIGTPVQLTGVSSSAGVANCNPVTFAAIASGSTITQIVCYKDTGTPSTSQLIFREDVASTPTNGGTITVTPDTGSNKLLKL